MSNRLQPNPIDHTSQNETDTTHICLPLLPILPSSLDRRHALGSLAEVVEILVGDDFGFDEAALEIAVDGTCCLGSETAAWDGPAADFFLAGCLMCEHTYRPISR